MPNYPNFPGVQAPALNFWSDIEHAFCVSRGIYTLGNSNNEARDSISATRNFFLNAGLDDALDIIEMTFQKLPSWQEEINYRRYIPSPLESEDTISPDAPDRMSMFSSTPMGVDRVLIFADEAIAALNERFEQHHIGYEFVDGQLIKKDSQFIHAEVTKPALNLLHDMNFRGASDEFLKAQDHYRYGRYKESIVEALKAFESTMKSIYDARRWSYSATGTAATLIGVAFTNELIPSYLQSQFTALRGVLESGVPTARNRTSGHGQGSEVTEVPPYLAAYILHLTAANIVFLVNSHKAKP